MRKGSIPTAKKPKKSLLCALDIRKCSSVAEHQLPKLDMRVRFPSFAPIKNSRSHRAGIFVFCPDIRFFSLPKNQKNRKIRYCRFYLLTFRQNRCIIVKNNL